MHCVFLCCVLTEIELISATWQVWKASSKTCVEASTAKQNSPLGEKPEGQLDAGSVAAAAVEASSVVAAVVVGSSVVAGVVAGSLVVAPVVVASSVVAGVVVGSSVVAAVVVASSVVAGVVVCSIVAVAVLVGAVVSSSVVTAVDVVAAEVTQISWFNVTLFDPNSWTKPLLLSNRSTLQNSDSSFPVLFVTRATEFFSAEQWMKHCWLYCTGIIFMDVYETVKSIFIALYHLKLSSEAAFMPMVITYRLPRKMIYALLKKLMIVFWCLAPPSAQIWFLFCWSRSHEAHSVWGAALWHKMSRVCRQMHHSTAVHLQEIDLPLHCAQTLWPFHLALGLEQVPCRSIGSTYIMNEEQSEWYPSAQQVKAWHSDNGSLKLMQKRGQQAFVSHIVEWINIHIVKGFELDHRYSKQLCVANKTFVSGFHCVVYNVVLTFSNENEFFLAIQQTILCCQ